MTGFARRGDRVATRKHRQATPAQWVARNAADRKGDHQGAAQGVALRTLPGCFYNIIKRFLAHGTMSAHDRHLYRVVTGDTE